MGNPHGEAGRQKQVGVWADWQKGVNRSRPLESSLMEKTKTIWQTKTH